MKRIVGGLVLAVCSTVGAQEAAVPRGQQVFARWCWACHGPGIDKPGSNALMGKYQRPGPQALDQGQPIEPGMTRYFVRHGISVMPPFRKTEISDAELDDLAAYLARGPEAR